MKPNTRSSARARPDKKSFSGGKRGPFKPSRAASNRDGDERSTAWRDGPKRESPKRDFKKRSFDKPKFDKSDRDDFRGRREGSKPDFKKRSFDKPRFDRPKFDKPVRAGFRDKRDDRKTTNRSDNDDGAQLKYVRPQFDKPARGDFRDKRESSSRDFKKRSFDKPARSDFRDKRESSDHDFKKRSFDKPKFDKPARDNFRDKRDDRKVIDHSDKKNDGTVMIWGLHAVRAAWMNPKRKCLRLWLSESGQKTFEESIVAARDALLKRPDPKKSDRTEMDRLTPPGSVHQGILLEVEPLREPSLHDLISGDNPPDCLVMLDQVTDPHNIGAILRSAAALGAGGVILTERNAPSMTGVLAKSASGAADHIPQVHVVNLSRALDELREAGYWSIGLAEEGESNIANCDLSGRTVIVLGAEGEGLRQLTRKKCDQLARLPTSGPIGSLNVSNAAAVALYEAKRQKAKTKN